MNEADDSGKLRWGVMGTARIVRKTIPALQASRNAEVVAVASRSAERAQDHADTYGVPQALGSYEALLAADDIDAVYIPLPNSLHHEWTIKALGNGKHVLCEKPLALSAKACREIEAVARETGLKVLEGFMYRFHPRFEKLLELLAAGAVGTLSFIHVGHTFEVGGEQNIRYASSLGGGALYDVGCYCVHVSRTVTAEEPTQVAGFATYEKASDEGQIDTAFAGMMRFPSGAAALFDAGIRHERRNVLELTGTHGRLVVHSPFSLLEEDSVIEEHHHAQETVYHKVKGQNPFVRMFEHFSECALYDRPLRYDLIDAIYNARALMALERAGQSARR